MAFMDPIYTPQGSEIGHLAAVPATAAAHA